MRTKFLLFLVMLAVLSATAFLGTAKASPITIDFSTGVGTDLGLLSYAGGASPLIGTNILIGAVRGVGAPSNALVTDTITAGLLSFTTGNFLSYNAGTQTYTFGSGGTLSITGSGPGCLTIGGCGGNLPNIPSGPTLLSGVQISAEYVAGLVNLYITTGIDIMDPTLVRFFGENPAAVSFWDFAGSVHATIASGGGGGSFTATSTHSTDISTSPVPEPSSLLLLGTGTLAMIGAVRRKWLA